MMKHNLNIKSFFLVILAAMSLNVKAQENVLIELPESYELSNIILALTQYGRTDQYEVMKNTQYYRDILAYFEPVKNHPLLDSVNYSREKWDYYLSFRTDAYAFAFDENNRLKRVIEFYSMDSITPFDKHIDLINDFVQQSNFRAFFTSKKNFYDNMVENYKKYHFVGESMEFLKTKIGKPEKYTADTKLITVLSPLVFRMNCHRNIDEKTSADFTSASEDFVNGIFDSKLDSRVVANHMLFTEMDHGYVNPISDKYEKLINTNFKNSIWDRDSGYPGSACFNEYMTWAVYDLFVQENFPVLADSIALQWQYQNASRGFIAQNLFASKVTELYAKSGRKNLETIYKPLLKWCKKVEQTITLPELANRENKFVEMDPAHVRLTFSEAMDTRRPFGMEMAECKDKKLTGRKKVVEVTNARWSEDGKAVEFALDTEYDEYALFFNYWGIRTPLLSANGILLKVQSYVMFKKPQKL